MFAEGVDFLVEFAVVVTVLYIRFPTRLRHQAR
jgi:hypothetical protein